MVEVDKLIEHPRNPNTHPDNQIKILSKTIKLVGFRRPIVVSNRSGFVIAGHGRIKAARNLGMGKVPVDFQNYKNEAEEFADLLADNRIPELSKTDNAILGEVLFDLQELDFNIADIGFDDFLSASQDEQGEEALTSTESAKSDRFLIEIECETEEAQVDIINRLDSEGIKCRALIL